ncbi:MAG: energy-coupling factor transporter transmembrane component T family protein [Planctomycetota bacterium]
MHRQFEVDKSEVGGTIVNPKICLLLTIIFITFVVTSKQIELPKFVLYIFYLLILNFCTCQSLKAFVSSFVYILPFLIFLFIMFVPYLFCKGETFFITICKEKTAFSRMLQTAMKMSLSITAMTIYIKGFNKSTIVESLKWLGLPRVISSIITIALLYVESFILKIKKMLIAMRFRIFCRISYFACWKLIASKIGMLFLHSYKRLIMLHHSLRLRGYTGTLPSFDSAPLEIPDFLFFVIMVTLIITIKFLSIVYFY